MEREKVRAASRKLAITNRAPHDSSAFNSDAIEHQIISKVARSKDHIRIFLSESHFHFSKAARLQPACITRM